MADELSTKLSLDLNTQSVEADINSLTLKMNALMKQMGDQSKGLSNAGKSGEAMRQVAAQFDEVKSSAKSLAETLNKSMGKSANFSGMSSELADIVKRLDALEVKMDAVLSPTKIQDFVATFSKLDEVISHINAGKLEYVFKEASASLETLRTSMQDFLVMMREFSSTLQNLDSGSLGKQAAGVQKATRSSTPSSSSDQGAINSKQSIASLKEIETQSYLTATALDEVKKKLVEALNDSGSEDDRSFIRITELLENRRAVVQDIVAFFDELNREGSVDRDSDPLSDRIARLGQSLKNLEKKGVGEGQIKQVQLMITALEEIQDAFQEIDSFSLDDPKATESITRVVTQLQDLFDKLASGDIKSVEEFTGQYKKLVKEFESLTGDDHVLSSNTHIDQIEALLNFILKAQNKYDDMLAKRNSRDEQKSNILGIDVETLQSISERASDIIAKFNERILTLGDTEKLGRFNGIKSIVEDMEKVEAALGQGIHTEQWDADLNKLRQIIEIQQQANRNPEWRNLEIVRDYLSSIQPQNAEQAANAARTAADEAQREAAARQEILNLAAKARELVEDTTLPSGSGTPQNNTLTVNLGQVEEKIEGVNASLLKLTEGFTSEFPAMSAGVQQLVQEMTRLNQTATETSSALREMQTQRIGLDAESLKALTDAVTRGYQQANQGAKELAGTSDQVSESARKAMDAIESEAQQATSNVAQVGFQADRVIENLDSRLKVVSKEISGINSEGQKMSALVDADGKVISASRETRNDNEAIKKANSLLAEQKKTISEIYSLRAEMLKSDGGTQEQAKRLEELNARYEEIKATLESMPENVLSQRSVAKGLQDNAYLETSKQQAQAQAEEKKAYAETEAKIRELESALRDLIKAQNEYRTAVRNKDESGQRQRSEEISNAKQLIQTLSDDLSTRQLTEQQEQRVARAIAESTAQQNKHNAALAVMQKSGAELDRMFQRMTHWVVQMLVIRQLREVWRDALSYAKEYYDALNEIRVVSGATAEEAEQLGVQYRAMAQQMNITSTSIAKAAVSIYRQGYQGSDVQGVTRGAAIFGAITAKGTDSALQTMTAALQNFQREGESMEELAIRISDSWSLLGDSVATSAEDIGTAISKVAGSATNVNLSLERTSAMAAVIMAKTQESAQAIGTSLNSMISRYTKITEAGFNSIITDEDGEMVKFNDVAKALAQANIECYNAIDGFKDYDAVLSELGPKWKTLSKELQNYIAYQMSGSRNLNRFVTLMNNWEQVVSLTNSAQNSGGTAMEKYNIWMQSVEAAENNLANSLESLYATLMNGDVIKGFYNNMAGFVDLFTEGTQAMGGMNLILPIQGAGIAGVAIALYNAGGAAAAFNAAMSAHPVMLVVSAIALVTTGITALVGKIHEASQATQKAIENTSALSGSLQESHESVRSISSTLSNLQGVAEPTAQQVSDLEAAISQQAAAAPDLAEKFGLDAQSIDNFAGSVDNATAAQNEYMRTERYAKFSEAHSGLGDAKKSFNDAYNTLNGDSSSYRRYLNGNIDYGQNPSTQTIIDGTIKTVQDAEAKLSDLQGEQERYTALIMSYVGNAQDGYTAFGQMLMDQGVDVSNIANMSVEAIKQIETAWNAMSGYNDWRDSLFGEKYASEFNNIKSWLGSLSKVNAAITDTEVQLETIRSAAQAQLREAASVIIADTLNPAQFPNLTMEELFNLEELLNNLDWSDKTYDEIRAIASNAAIQMTDEMGNAIKTANEHVAQAKSFGMSEMLYQALMGDLDQFSGTVFEGMFDEPIRALLKEWESQKGAAIDAIGEGGEELVQRLADEGILSGAVLDAITNGIEGLRSQGREGEVAEVVAGLLSLDSLGSTEAEAVAIVDGYFNSLGVTLDENIQAQSELLSAGNEAILDAAEKIGKSSLSRTNYKDMFDMLLGTSANFDGMASMQEAALQIARSLLSGITDNEDVIKEYAEEILKDFIGANGWIVDFIDQESGSLNSAAFDAGGSVSQSFYDGMASVAGELMRSDQLARIMSGLFDSTIEDILSSGLDEAGMENFISSFNLLPEGTQDALMSAYPQLESFFTMISSGAYDSEEALRQLMSVLEQMNMDTLAMTSAPTQKAANAFASISGDTSQDRSDTRAAMGDYITQVNSLISAEHALRIAQDETKKGTDEYNEAQQTVADYLGLPVEALGDQSYASSIITSDFAAMDDATLSLANALARMAGIDLGAENLTQQLDLASANEETRSFAEALRILLGLCDYTVQDGMFTSIEISANSANTAVSELRKTVEGYAASAERSREFMTGEERASAYNSNYRDMAEGIDYLQKKMQEATEDSFLEALEAALKDLDAEGILQPLAENFELIQSLVNGDIESLDELLELLEELSEQADDMNLEALAFMGNSERESNRASENNYADQIEAMLEAFNDGGFEDMMEQWNEFDESMQRSIADSWPELIQAMYEAQEASQDLAHALEENGGVLDENSEEAKAAQKAYSRLNAVLDDTTNIATSKYFRTTAKDMQSLAKGTGRLQDAVADYNKEQEAAQDAIDAFNTIQSKGIGNFSATSNEIKTLANWLGVTEQMLLQNWDASGISNAIGAAAGEAEGYLAQLQNAAIIEFVLQGHSDVDLSQVQGQLISTENITADALALLQQLGLFTVETVDMGATYWRFNALTNQMEKMTATNSVQVLKPTGGNPLKVGGSGRSSGGSGGGKGGGGGGGGGGSSSAKVSSAVQNLLDEVTATKELYDYRLKLINLAKDYYKATGELRGVIEYTKQEITVTQEQNDALLRNIETQKAAIAAKEAVMAKNKASSKTYKQAAIDVEALREELEANIEAYAESCTSIVELTKALDELHEEIRQTRISVEDMIRDILQAEDDAARAMLKATKDVEDEILDILTKRYENQRDLELEALEDSIRAAEARRDAIDAEIDALDEALARRKELADMANNEKELAELEAQYARISSDPTRAREALELYEKIQKKREEIAWESAEKEVEAQKKQLEGQRDALDSEIDKMEDQMDEIDRYYEEQFKHPEELMAELKEIMKGSDAEILEWLKNNFDEFANSTETTQQYMIQEWQDMLNEMRGFTETYEEQIKEIMSWTDEEIIEWMTQHSIDFQNATDTARESFIYGWRETLEAWRKAFEDVTKEITDMTKIEPVVKSSSSSSSSSSKSSSSSSSSSKSSTTTTARFVASGTGSAEAYKATATTITYNGVVYVDDPHSSYWFKKSDAKSIDAGRTYYWSGKTRYVKKYASGGIADYTGLAMLDGTKSRPERILSAYQTELFEDMLSSLHSIRTMRVPSFAPIAASEYSGDGAGGQVIEEINIHVAKLDSDADYEEIANQVGKVLEKKITKGKAIGGIRIF